MRVLFVLGGYFPKAGANGVCVLRVQDELKKHGIFSDVVAEGEQSLKLETPFGYAYYVPVIEGKNYPLSKKAIAVLRYPIYYPQNIANYENAIDLALAENDYDAIIGVLKPLSGALASAKYSNLIIYELDSITNNDDNEHSYRKLFRNRVFRVENDLYRKADYIFHMESHRLFYSQERYNAFFEKSDFLDIPQLVDEGLSYYKDCDKKHIRILYSGILSKPMRSPEYIISLIKMLNGDESVDCVLEFYSRGNCENILEQAQVDTNGAVKRHGYVSLEELNAAVSKTDFMLSIGNNLSGKVTSLPSKVISYMAYGKPIIHVDGGNNDVAKEYLSKYPLSMIINPNLPLTENEKLLYHFLKDNAGKHVEFDSIKQVFERNTPEFTVNQILHVVSERCSGKVMKLK